MTILSVYGNPDNPAVSTVGFFKDLTIYRLSRERLD
jgi:hypothetical protein